MADSLFTWFTKKHCPSWYCPACLRETLAIDQDSFVYHFNNSTKRIGGELWFDSWHVEYVFSCLLRCQHHSCKEVIAVTGEGKIVESSHRGEQNFEDSFRARTFYPPLPLFLLPENCPDEVRLQLKEVASLLTGHPAAANVIRSLLEKLLDDMHVRREDSREGKKPRALTLNKRIEMNPELLGNNQQGIKALKLIGNAGSHGSEAISQEHLEDACHVLELLINQIYPHPSDVSLQIDRLQKAFGKGPV